MRCDEVQAYLAEHLTSLLADRLSGKVQSHIRDHVMSCADCCEELEDFEEMQEVLRSLPVEPCDSAAMRAKFDSLMMVRDAKVPPSHARRTRPDSRTLLAAAGILVIVTAVLIVARNHKTPAVTNNIPVVESLQVPVEASTVVAAPVAAIPEPPGTLNGHVLMEDGTAISDPALFGEIAVRSESGSGRSSLDTVRVDSSGRFIRSLAAGRYRIRVAGFSQDYVIRSITSGTSDLMKDTIQVNADSAANVEIRVARNRSNSGRVRGTVIRGRAEASSPDERVQLCCFRTEATERRSAPILPDGTFEFTGVPPGHYSAELRGNPKLSFANASIDVPSEGVSGWILNAVTPFVPIDVTLKLDTDGRLPYHPATSIVFTGHSGKNRVAASAVVGNLFRASVPSDEEYSVTVTNVADGYAVQSITDSNNADLLSGGQITVSSDSVRPPGVTVTLTKN